MLAMLARSAYTATAEPAAIAAIAVVRAGGPIDVAGLGAFIGQDRS
jgi:hypothetical protein